MTAPAQFRRITPETELTVPCVLVYQHKGIWSAVVIDNYEWAIRFRVNATHWLPVQWPEVRG